MLSQFCTFLTCMLLLQALTEEGTLKTHKDVWSMSGQTESLAGDSERPTVHPVSVVV